LICYIEPKILNDNNELMKPYSLNEKSDVYSIGVILWEISSGQPPFKDESYNDNLILQILQGHREAIVSNTPLDYSILYTGKYALIILIINIINLKSFT
jgi:serine/threonine protein kinase